MKKEMTFKLNQFNVIHSVTDFIKKKYCNLSVVRLALKDDILVCDSVSLFVFLGTKSWWTDGSFVGNVYSVRGRLRLSGKNFYSNSNKSEL